MTTKAKRLPRGFRKGHGGDLACPHRDVSCCEACAQKHEEIVEVYGQHFWVTDPAERIKRRPPTAIRKPLTLEVRKDFYDATHTPGSGALVMCSEVFDHWVARVRLTDTQALLAFPKFLTIGIGFEKETDWNTNLPAGLDAERIYEHIKHNAGDKAITREVCLEAIQMLQAHAARLLAKGKSAT